MKHLESFETKSSIREERDRLRKELASMTDLKDHYFKLSYTFEMETYDLKRQMRELVSK